MKFKKDDKVKVVVFNPFNFGNRRWVDGVVTSFMEDFTKHRNDGKEYYAVDLKGMDTGHKDVHFFAVSDGMFKEGEKLPDINEIVEDFIKEFKKEKENVTG